MAQSMTLGSVRVILLSCVAEKKHRHMARGEADTGKKSRKNYQHHAKR